MKIFLDTADVSVIKDYYSTGLIDGVTTNPTLIQKSGKKMIDVITEICSIVQGSVSAEVISLEHKGMLDEANELIKISPNICIKLPITKNGLMVAKILSQKGVQTNLTLCFSATQALMVAKSGATFVSPFIGRLDDIGLNGVDLVSNIKNIYNIYGLETQVIAASVRTINHFLDCAMIGADVATIPPALFDKLYQHPLTDKGIEIFLEDYKKSVKA